MTFNLLIKPLSRQVPRVMSRSFTSRRLEKIPAPLENCKTPEEFLKLIGRDTVKHVSHFKEWKDLFIANGATMSEMGIPIKPRKWIMSWTSKMRLDFKSYAFNLLFD
ncbi:hypothetical protein BB560_000998 [Smittium megazygosporum]|uniref:Small ribosomal subunit protein mS41 n=1 Tax=Smittium megazygosporum TaxID=133381 RepID=A0A2T9ZIV8_9FUNG|nr:hypothetical protein BB560_000998 [Smittium megazygosporum]